MKKNENGRSMVEMLGVLAIIGVLSVAGLKGYTIAMRKYRANEIAHVISMMATAMRTANGGEGIDAEHQKTYKELLEVDSDLAGVDSLMATSDTTILLETDENPELCEAVEQLFGDDHSNPIYVNSTNTDCDEDQLELVVNN